MVMRKTLWFGAALAVGAILFTGNRMLSRSTRALPGVWSVEEVSVIGGPDAGTNGDPQPSLWIFTNRHYSESFVSTVEPRAIMVDDQNPTDAEIVAAYDSLVFSAGTYETDWKGSVLTLRPSIARNPNFVGYAKPYDFRVDGDTLWLTRYPVHDDQQFREIRKKLTRIE